MDTQTLNRNKGDLNVNSQSYLSSNKHISIQSQSITEKTQSLSIISNNETQLVLKDILALEGQIDNNLFNEEFKFRYLLTERIEFHNIEQIINQRLLIEYSQNCSVYICMMIGSQQQIVIKEMLFYKEEEIIKILDEFKIHNKLNKLFPKQSLLLFIPVQVQKLRQSYGLKAAMEKAEANLFLYSKKNKISEDQAFIIYRQLLQQLINMHSVQIAHRDVKPQNIFYVNNKGWLLSDFGESLEYDELESNYSIRGTLYFLMPYIQAQVNQRQKILQNLLVNDLYALVISIIIIQKIHDRGFIDIQLEIKMLTDSYLIQSLNIKTYQQLVQFDQELPQFNQEFQFNIHDNYYKQLSPKEEQINKLYTYRSWISLCYYYIEDQIFPDITNQLFQLINENLNQIQNNIDYNTGISLSKIQLGRSNFDVNPLRVAKAISRMNMKQIEFVIQFLFNQGYSERTILYCQQVLKNQYNQFIHLKLIDSLERLLMYSEAQQQFNIFQQGLIFEQLNSDYQQQFLAKIIYYGQNNLQFDLEQQLEDLVVQKNIELLNGQAFEQDLNQYEQFDSRNTDLLVNLLEIQMKQYCGVYNVFSFKFFSHFGIILSGFGLNIQQEAYRRIYLLRIDVLDMTRRTAILFDLGQIYILQKNMTNFRQIVKMVQISIFRAESQQQIIIFKIQMLVLKFNKLYNKKGSHAIINKLYLNIKKLKQISYNVYRLTIQEYLLSILNSLHYGNFNYICPKGIKVVMLIIHHMESWKYYQQNFELFRVYHLRSQKILIRSLNLKRQLNLIRDDQNVLDDIIKNFFKHISGYKQAKYHKIFNKKESEFQRQKLFLFEQFLQKE